MLSYHNRKINHLQEALGVRCAAFDLPCGWTCPFAKDCKSKVREIAGRRVLEREGEFQCYASKAELLYPAVYRRRQLNWIASKDSGFVSLMINEIKTEAVKVVRLHSSGDFYNWEYFEKWKTIADELGNVVFFGYTKSPYAVDEVISKDLNIHLVYSWGGLRDSFAETLKLPTCYVDMHGEHIGKMPVIDSSKDSSADYGYIMAGQSFAIKLH